MDLEEMKKKIDTLDKEHHIQILKIIKNSPVNHTLNENKNGVFVNLSVLQEETVENIRNYLDYLNQQENLLIDLETQKEDVKNTFFIEKEDKANSINMFSYQV
jgi:transcriptional regulator of heat shock response